MLSGQNYLREERALLKVGVRMNHGKNDKLCIKF
jgi:hypothetical protein